MSNPYYKDPKNPFNSPNNYNSRNRFSSGNNFNSTGSGGSGGICVSGCGGCASIVLGFYYLMIMPIIGIFALVGGVISLIGVAIATNDPNRGKPIIIVGSVIGGVNLVTCCGAGMIKKDTNQGQRTPQYSTYCRKCGIGLSRYAKICPNCATRVISPEETQKTDYQRVNEQEQREIKTHQPKRANTNQSSQIDLKNTAKISQNEEKVKKLKELFSISKRVKIEMAANFIGVEADVLKEIIISNKTEFHDVEFEGDFINVR